MRRSSQAGWRGGSSGACRTWAAVLVTLLVTGCGLGPRQPRPERIVLISADGVRGDVLEDPALTLPALEGIATEGVRFVRCYTASTSTIPAHASLLTGLDAEVHGVVDGTREPPADVDTLATRLRTLGYRTQAFAELGEQGVRRGFEGFEQVERVPAEGDAGAAVAVMDRARRWMEEHAGERYFLFLQTAAALVPSASAADPAALREAYAERLGGLDAALGSLRASLEEWGEWEDTLLLFTSGHGQAFLERGLAGHEFVPFEEVLRVPLIVSFPALLPPEAPEEVRELVWHLDVYPSVVAMADREILPEGEAIDLTAVLLARRNVPGYRTLFPRLLPGPETMPAVPRRVVLRKDAKLVEGHPSFARAAGAKGDLLFDLEADPGERVALAEQDAEFAAPLREELATYLGGLRTR